MQRRAQQSRAERAAVTKTGEVTRMEENPACLLISASHKTVPPLTGAADGFEERSLWCRNRRKVDGVGMNKINK